jgi:uncharacterized protein YndB with AHSA1/START domain
MTLLHDKVLVETTVAVPLARAFEVFTRETDLWWRRGPAFRVAGHLPSVLELEPRLGGRLFETFDTKSGTRKSIVVGRVLAWEPPARVVFEWRNVNFTDSEKTEVEVCFTETEGGGTRVTLEHRGWAAIREGHPARHGKEGPALMAMIGAWWGEQLTALGRHSGP